MSPPLGCPFHPRCPRAFEVCGWESRDLSAIVEEHWTKLADEELAREREVVDLASLATAGGRARLPAGSGHTGGDVVEILQRIRRDALDDLFWRGVRDVRADDTAAAVSFHEALVPRPIVVGNTRVECHLHDSRLV